MSSSSHLALVLALALLPLLYVQALSIPFHPSSIPRLGPYRRQSIHHPSSIIQHPSSTNHPSVLNCTEYYYTSQKIDHFSSSIIHHPQDFNQTLSTFAQRYFICDPLLLLAKNEKDDRRAPTIFFYTGNEADVELYVNNTGFMWESAKEFRAVLVFAEHRYYGKSQPFPDFVHHFSRHFSSSASPLSPSPLAPYLTYLSSSQALADYSQLILYLRSQSPFSVKLQLSPVITFGGSYGGMLAAWMKIKYSSVVQGAVASSAPIWAFYYETPDTDEDSFANIVTSDASSPGGSPATCAANIKQAWSCILDLQKQGLTGYQQLNSIFRLCPSSLIQNDNDVWTLIYFIQSAYDYMSMGDYPYEDNYITNGGACLPAFPMRAACAPLADRVNDQTVLLTQLHQSISIFYNTTGSQICYNTTASVNPQSALDDLLWSYQSCTQLMMPQSRRAASSMFLDQIFDIKAMRESCMAQFNVSPDLSAATVEYGGKFLGGASNIVFPNGKLDPWSGTGVLPPSSTPSSTPRLPPSIIPLLMDDAAHHLDLFYAHINDPASVTQARLLMKGHMTRWIDEYWGMVGGR